MAKSALSTIASEKLQLPGLERRRDWASPKIKEADFGQQTGHGHVTGQTPRDIAL